MSSQVMPESYPLCTLSVRGWKGKGTGRGRGPRGGEGVAMGNIQDTPAIPQYCEYFLAWVIDVAKTSVLDVTAVCTSDLYPLDPLFTVQVLRLQEKKKKKAGSYLQRGCPYGR